MIGVRQIKGPKLAPEKTRRGKRLELLALPDIEALPDQAFDRQAKKRLLILTRAVSRNGLMQLPSNRFEALGGDRKGQFSLRINQQWKPESLQQVKD